MFSASSTVVIFVSGLFLEASVVKRARVGVCMFVWESERVCVWRIVQGDSLAGGPKLLSIKIMLLILKGDHFRHRLWAGPVLHRSRYVYINFQVLVSVT